MYVGRCGFRILIVFFFFCRFSGLFLFLGEIDVEIMNFIVNCNWDFDVDSFEGFSEEVKDFVFRLLVKEKRYFFLFVIYDLF